MMISMCIVLRYIRSVNQISMKLIKLSADFLDKKTLAVRSTHARDQ